MIREPPALIPEPFARWPVNLVCNSHRLAGKFPRNSMILSESLRAIRMMPPFHRCILRRVEIVRVLLVCGSADGQGTGGVAGQKLRMLSSLPGTSLTFALFSQQIKVRDMSTVSVNLQPAEFSNWQEARTSLMAEAKSTLRAKLEAELSALADDTAIDSIKDVYNSRERELEHSMDHTVHTFSAMLDLEYKCAVAWNRIRLHTRRNPCECGLTAILRCAQLPLQVDTRAETTAQASALLSWMCTRGAMAQHDVSSTHRFRVSLTILNYKRSRRTVQEREHFEKKSHSHIWSCGHPLLRGGHREKNLPSLGLGKLGKLGTSRT
jgi:hypothetical protein